MREQQSAMLAAERSFQLRGHRARCAKCGTVLRIFGREIRYGSESRNRGAECFFVGETGGAPEIDLAVEMIAELRDACSRLATLRVHGGAPRFDFPIQIE